MNRIIFKSTVVLLVTAILLLTPLNKVSADGGGEGGIEKEVNGYHIMLVFVKPATMGENEFHIQITDSMGMPVSNAEVEVTAMPAENIPAHDEGVSVETHDTDSMDGMNMSSGAPTAEGMDGMVMATETPATGVMRANNESEPGVHDEQSITVMLEPAHELGEYSGEISLDKSGAWIFNVHFTINGEMTTAEFPVEVVRAGSNLGVLAGFLGFNATVIAAAAFMKRKPILK